MNPYKDLSQVLFDDESRAILYSLVDRNKPSKGLVDANDDYFQPTISALFMVFKDIMVESTPDLCQAEWKMICQALEQSSISRIQRLPSTLGEMRPNIVMSLEDLAVFNGEIGGIELSRKIAGFSSISACAIYYHAQKYFVAKKRNESYNFPNIDNFK